MKRLFTLLASLVMTMALVGSFSSNVYASQQLPNNSNQKVVILTFDDGYKSQYSNAKPILDKYGFKATFSIVCNYVGNGDNRMTWEEIKSLRQEGHDIASHTMNHDDLSKLPPQTVEYEVAQSKQCLLDQGINPKSFAYPFNGGSDDPTVLNIVASHYDLARTATGPLAFLSCGDDSECTTNKYSIMGWSHDSEKKNNAYNDQQMLDRFVQVVNSQNEYNTNGVNAVPILIWHKIDNTNEEYSTSMDLLEAEMKYLYDNGFTVLTMADLVSDEGSNYLKINDGNDNVPIPATERDFAAKINDVDEDNSPDNARSKEEVAESGISTEEVREENGNGEEFTPTIDGEYEEGDNTELEGSQYRYPQQQDIVNNGEETEGEIPSSILPFLNEP
ncbi:MAG: polysaccharide deacetylase family protein [Nitrososphaeraceae archaeon]|nr:polysaccharide deacetylase family protein [Nitrososphaeraceae archaeon]MDW0332387.1 polysaccharide deacetylase family protein [Nitrososphaeraceae archaeon]